MKKIICLLALGITTICMAHAAGSATWVNHPEPSASFDKIWVDYDITEAGVKGMRIHLKFTAYEMKGMDAYVAVYFEFDDEQGGVLKDKNGKFNSSTGDVAVYKLINPSYNPAVYEDLQVFMPYSELDLNAGTYDLSMDVKLIYKEGGMISKLTNYEFEYTKPGLTPVNMATKADARFEDLWVDYDVTENGQRGMRIHVKFTALNLKDVDCYLAVYFEHKNGDKLLGTGTNYRSKSGQLAVYKTLSPGYKETVYNDATLFLPYSQFDLTRGKHDLKLDADVIYKNGDLLKHLKFHDFWFEM